MDMKITFQATEYGEFDIVRVDGQQAIDWAENLWMQSKIRRDSSLLSAAYAVQQGAITVSRFAEIMNDYGFKAACPA